MVMTCNQCGADWEARVESPVQCPRCKRVDWAEPKKWSMSDMMDAHAAVAKALRAGTLVKKPCEHCGTEVGVQGHHENYDKPLEVVWLCQKDHDERHREIGNLVKYSLPSRPARPMTIFTCKACGMEWCFRGVGSPLRCGKCKSPYWDRERVNEGGGDKGGGGDGAVVHLGGGGRHSAVEGQGKPVPSGRGDEGVGSVAADEHGSDEGAGKDAEAVAMCPYSEYNPDDGETYRCGLAEHGPKVKHGKWRKV